MILSLSKETQFLSDIQPKTSNDAGNLHVDHRLQFLESGKILKISQTLQKWSPGPLELSSNLSFLEFLTKNARYKSKV